MFVLLCIVYFVIFWIATTSVAFYTQGNGWAIALTVCFLAAIPVGVKIALLSLVWDLKTEYKKEIKDAVESYKKIQGIINA